MITTPTTSSEERTAAALAHASTLFTLLVGLPTAGLGGVLFAFIPFLIYLSYKDKSRFVAFHAAQAFSLQVVGTVGFFLSIVVGVILIAVVWVVTGLLTAILIGLILIPVAILVTLVVVVVWLGAPFVFGAVGIVGTIESANGRDYHYPFLGRWVDDWLSRHESGSAPAV
jgi:hypothetical protein